MVKSLYNLGKWTKSVCFQVKTIMVFSEHLEV